ncbi:hypothetical protein ACUN8C_01140 [Kushneria sp. Sum13]
MSYTLDLLIYPNCQLLNTSGPWRVFSTANDLAGKPLYRARFGSGAFS